MGKESNNAWKPLVIIVPLRLGLHSVNVEYVEQLKVGTSDDGQWLISD